MNKILVFTIIKNLKIINLNIIYSTINYKKIFSFFLDIFKLVN